MLGACIDKALRCKASDEPKTLFINLSGHCDFDMAAYENYFSGKMQERAYSDADLPPLTAASKHNDLCAGSRNVVCPKIY